MALTDGQIVLQRKLNALRRRVRVLRAIQGLCRLALVLAVLAFVGVIADAYFHFPAWARGCVLGIWVVLAIVELRLALIRPLREPIDSVALAATVETEYPRLDERLTTAAELFGGREAANGSPGLVDEVVRETEIRTARIDFGRAAPVRGTLWFAAVSIFVLGTILSPLAVVQGAGEHIRRFFLPWRNPAAEAPFRIVVSSGNPGVARGDAITLAAYLTPTRPDAVLPTQAMLVVRDARGTIERSLMRQDQENVFFLRRPAVEADFDYRVEVGPVESDWFHVTAVEPVTVVEARVRIRPPAYAAAAENEKVVEGLAELRALQHSRLTFELRLDRPPQGAWIDWIPEADDRTGRAAARRWPLEVNAENRTTLTVPALASGSYRIVLQAEHSVQNEYAPQALQVRPDRPPRFERVRGVMDQPRSVRPGEPIAIAAAASDDIAVSGIQVEYRINGGDVATATLPLRGEGTPRAGGTLTLRLGDQLTEGDQLEYRLVAADNRNVPDAGLESQLTYFPADGNWSVLRATPAATPLAEQEIALRKEQVDQKLKELIGRLGIDRQSVRSFKAATARQAGLRPDQEERLAEYRDSVREAGKQIIALARDVALSDGLSALTTALRAIQSNEISAAAGAIVEAESEPAADARNRSLDSADGALGAALEKLEALHALNERLTAERLNRQRLERLAEEQQALADRAAKADPEAAKQLGAAQRELEDRLQKLLQQSDRFREAVNERDAQAVAEQADTLRQLAKHQRDLADASRETDRQSRQGRFADLVRRQEALAQQVQRLAERTLAPTRAAQIPPLDPDKARLAREALAADKPHEAVQLQEKAALDLDRLAGHLEGAAAVARDPREATRQLARLQEDLLQRLDQECKGLPFSKLPAERQRAFAAEQDTIRRATEQLALPGDGTVSAARREALEHAGRSAAALAGTAPANLGEAMTATRDALNRIADRLPPLEKRLAAARQDVTALRAEQEAIAKQVEQAARGLEKLDPEIPASRRDFAQKLGDAAKRQAKVLERLLRLDLPTLEQRRLLADQAMQLALEDLKDGSIQDAPASQQAARRELDRLELADAGRKPADEKADELARRQRELAQLAAPVAKAQSKAGDLAARQAEIVRELQALPGTDAPLLTAEALEKARRAEEALTAGSQAGQAARLAREAAEAVEALAGQLAGRESDARRAARLAARQKAAADEADKRVKRPGNAAEVLEQRRRLNQVADELRQLRPGPPLATNQRLAAEAVLGTAGLAGAPTSAAREKQKALEALQQAVQPQAPERLAKLQRQAAESIGRLAQRLAQRDSGQPEPVRALPRLAGGMDPLPSTAEASAARKLSQDQRKLQGELLAAMDELSQPPSTADNPLAKLQSLQEDIARRADQLAKGADQTPGPAGELAKQAARAAEAAGEAKRHLQEGNVPPALQAGQQAAERLRQGAKTLGAEQAKQAAELAGKQEELNRSLGKLQGDPAAARTQQLARQEQLRRDAEQTATELTRLSGQLGRSDAQAGEKAGQAAESARSAEKAMAGAVAEGRKKNNAAMAEAQEQAAKALDEAALRAREAALNTERAPPGPPSELGKALGQAQRAMRQAQEELRKGKAAGAAPQMRQAADALGEAAEAGADSGGSPGRPGAGGVSSGGNDGGASGAPDLRMLGPEAIKYAGRPWGELPGEVRTRLVQDWTVRYGEDYARNIRYYFEQLAERK